MTHKMTQEELNKVIERHQHWINEDCEGWENMRVDFSHIDLSGMDFLGADLGFANFYKTNLEGANFEGA